MNKTFRDNGDGFRKENQCRKIKSFETPKEPH